jgi:hypothetical protein
MRGRELPNAENREPDHFKGWDGLNSSGDRNGIF